MDNNVRQIPRDFMLGSGVSAFQYEGAWDEDGKGPSLWDDMLHKSPDFIVDGSNADVAADGYHRYQDDIRLARDMGLDSFRLAISWPRILPTGYANNINRVGIDYYNNFIDELLKYNIIPIVTIFHMDLPVKLQDYGSWTNPAIVDLFLDYVKVVFDNFGDRVKIWVTINEPLVYCMYTYTNLEFPPFVDLPGVGDYMCMKNMLLAHARAYRLYDERYRERQRGKVGLVLYYAWYEPLTDSTEDVEAAEDYNRFMGGMYLNPIFSKSGDFPAATKLRVAAKSAEQGFPRSRLPTLSESEISMIKGSADFVGLNLYSTVFVYRNSSVRTLYPVPSVRDDLDAGLAVDPMTAEVAYRFESRPQSTYKLLMNIKEQYDPPVLITENGYANQGGLDDYDRIEYINDYLNAILDAKEAGCDVRGYHVWSFVDLFEWKYGYLRRFGLYEVDFSSPNRTRTARKSANYFRDLTTTRTLFRRLSLY
ncbi:myrosinase 1-like [Aricia agestis]|uniref:myrosinase 1-like n=1 Tax=Aricia agestis TaxID=91739 RepID=UPI001C20AD1F|nr:myrosinase 1-like [Aricia agestis]